ncbi:hypothetical protein B0J14DRAFT_687960 [Halenospora varia]|nr:hypothetical protein B0J14DRAFT_687960 [Halenospora varia]
MSQLPQKSQSEIEIKVGGFSSEPETVEISYADFKLSHLSNFLHGKNSNPPEGSLVVSIIDIGSGHQGILSHKLWDANVTPIEPSFWSPTYRGGFQGEINNEPCPGIKTRIIAVDMKYQHDPRHGSYPTGTSDIIEVLGSRFSIDALFFAAVISPEHGVQPKLPKAVISPEHSADPKLPKYQDRNGRYFETEFNTSHGRYKDGWGRGFYAASTIVDMSDVGYLPSCSRRFHSILSDVGYRTTYLNSPWQSVPPTKETILHSNHSGSSIHSFLQNLRRLTSGEIDSSNVQPVEYLTGIVAFHHRFFAYRTKIQRKLTHAFGPRDNAPELFDEHAKLSFHWWNFRSEISSYENLKCEWEEFVSIQRYIRKQDSSTFPESTVDSLNFAMDDLLKEAREVEANMRESIQMRVGHAALEASKESIKEAQSVRRITLLTFVFIPISLVTSFFGMNVQELTGEGPRIKWFLISSISLMVLVFFIWAESVKNMTGFFFVVELDEELPGGKTPHVTSSGPLK